MTKVWQMSDGKYLVNGFHTLKVKSVPPYELSIQLTKDVEEATKFEEGSPFVEQVSKYFVGKLVDYEEPLILTGAEILVEAVDEWSKSGNQDKEDWNNYWNGVLGPIKPDKWYKTNGDFSYFEEVSEDEA